MKGKLYKLVDTIIVVLCLPFYLIAIPVLFLYQWLLQRRGVRLGLEVTHWPAKGIREDCLVVDVSRVGEGIVGIRRRRWGVFGSGGSPPPYPDAVEYIRINRYWVPQPLFFRGST